MINQPNDMNREKFVDLIESNDIPFTDPQQEFVNNVLRGWSYTIENGHRMDGGTYVWVDTFGSHQYGGRLFSMIRNVSWKIQKTTGVDTNFHEWLKIK